MTWVIGILFILSLIANVFLFLRFKKPKTPTKQSLELKDFLYDLSSGVAMVEIKRVDPQFLFKWNPEGK